MSLLPTVLFACSASTVPPGAADPIPLDGHARVIDAVKDHKYLAYAVGEHIDAPPADVWAVLTKAGDYPRWNSTIVSVDGDIAANGHLSLTAKVDPSRAFDLDVSAFEPGRRMVWEDGSDNVFRGVRTFTLTERGGGTDWTMEEVFTGRMMGFIAPNLPDFTADFETFGADLKREAERVAKPVAE